MIKLCTLKLACVPVDSCQSFFHPTVTSLGWKPGNPPPFDADSSGSCLAALPAGDLLSTGAWTEPVGHK